MYKIKCYIFSLKLSLILRIEMVFGGSSKHKLKIHSTIYVHFVRRSSCSNITLLQIIIYLYTVETASLLIHFQTFFQNIGRTQNVELLYFSK